MAWKSLSQVFRRRTVRSVLATGRVASRQRNKTGERSRMDSNPESEAVASADRRTTSWIDYATVWRWHFYAGLLAAPFVMVLAVSGSLYLFKTEWETWVERPYNKLEWTGDRAEPRRIVEAALGAIEGAVLQGYELPPTPNAAARVLVRADSESVRTYVHPQSAVVLGSRRESDRFMSWTKRLHGELLMGDGGSYVVEVAASWTIVLVLTGLFLWWPRSGGRWAGVVYPRWGIGGRVFWRDLHSVTGIWISLFTLVLLFSGLPWSRFWGGYFKAARELTGTAVARQDWSTGGEARPRSEGDHAGHGSGRRARSASKAPVDLEPLARCVEVAQKLDLETPVVVSASGDGLTWTIKSNTPNRPRRVTVHVNSRTGEVVHRETFRDRHWIDQLVSVGIAFHEGRLFGWPNQLLGLFTAAGLVVLSGSGIVMWWKRRPTGFLGAPPISKKAGGWSIGLLMIIAALAIYLPLFGLTLAATWATERWVLARIPPIRRWLGLQPVDDSAASV